MKTLTILFREVWYWLSMENLETIRRRTGIGYTWKPWKLCVKELVLAIHGNPGNYSFKTWYGYPWKPRTFFIEALELAIHGNPGHYP